MVGRSTLFAFCCVGAWALPGCDSDQADSIGGEDHDHGDGDGDGDGDDHGDGDGDGDDHGDSDGEDHSDGGEGVARVAIEVSTEPGSYPFGFEVELECVGEGEDECVAIVWSEDGSEPTVDSPQGPPNDRIYVGAPFAVAGIDARGRLGPSRYLAYDIGLDVCPSGPLFTDAPFDGLLDADPPVGSISPLGTVAGAHVFPIGHTYMSMKTPETRTATIRAPAAGWATSIGWTHWPNREPQEEDGAIFIRACAEVDYQLGHVTHLSQRLKDLAAGPEGECVESGSGLDFRIDCNWQGDGASGEATFAWVDAGEIVGTKGPVPSGGATAVDFGVRDTRSADLDLWEGTIGNNGNHVCPYELFTDPKVQDALFALVGSDGDVAPDPRCGELNVTIPGAAQGKWFVSGTDFSAPPNDFGAEAEAEQLVLLQAVNHARQAFSTANPALDHAGYYFDPNDEGRTNRRFADVSPDGQVYCYGPLFATPNTGDLVDPDGDGESGSLYVQMPSSLEILLERNGEPCPADESELDAFTFGPGQMSFVRPDRFAP